jgi:imidazolonepropionase-like amidohydrolase
MNSPVLVVESYFDGERYHAGGPYTIRIIDGVIGEILPGDPGSSNATPNSAGDLIVAPFVMPGLTEAHCHLFLDGARLDPQVRKKYLHAPFPEMLQVGWKSLQADLAAGVTLIRDAGDLYGVNTHIKRELHRWTGRAPTLRSPGRAIRKAGRYGGFMAVEVNGPDDIAPTIRKIAATADDLKVLLTGIIDFAHGKMKGDVQFDLAQTRLIVQSARDLNLRTYAHCSGQEGLQIAVAAGIDSIEHGFFMSREILKAMAQKRIAWVPTFAPVYFQLAHPELAGWNARTLERLDAILQQHFEMVAQADAWGVPVLAGSDAGSCGVPHGTGLIDELFFLLRAGLPLEKVLAAATAAPRKLWGMAPANIAPGNAVDCVALAGSPFENIDFLRQVRLLVRCGEVFRPEDWRCPPAVPPAAAGPPAPVGVHS